jgi:hypothetical protein
MRTYRQSPKHNTKRTHVLGTDDALQLQGARRGCVHRKVFAAAHGQGRFGYSVCSLRVGWVRCKRPGFSAGHRPQTANPFRPLLLFFFFALIVNRLPLAHTRGAGGGEEGRHPTPPWFGLMSGTRFGFVYFSRAVALPPSERNSRA